MVWYGNRTGTYLHDRVAVVGGPLNHDDGKEHIDKALL